MKLLLVVIAAFAFVSVVSAVETAATCGQRSSCGSCSEAATCGWCPAASQCVHQSENPCFGMKLGCTDDKLEVELRSSDEKPFIVEADVANISAPAAAPKQKWVVFKSKTTNTPDQDENQFNSTSNPISDCVDLNRNNICDNQESKPVYADPCRGRPKCEYVDADVVGDNVAPETRDNAPPTTGTNSSLDDVVSALKQAEGKSADGSKVLSKAEVKADIAKAETKLENKAQGGAAGAKCEGEVCSDVSSLNGTSSGKVLSKAEIKADIAKAETKMEKKADNGTSGNAVADAIQVALKEAESATASFSGSKKSIKSAIAEAERQAEGMADQNSSGDKKKSSGRSESSGQEVKDEIIKDLQENRSFNETSSNSTDVSAVVAKIEKVKAKEDKKIQKAKAKINAQGALLNATIAKEENIADQIEQLTARITSIEGALSGTGGKEGSSPTGMIAQAVKKVKAYFRKALKDE